MKVRIIEAGVATKVKNFVSGIGDAADGLNKIATSLFGMPSGGVDKIRGLFKAGGDIGKAFKSMFDILANTGKGSIHIKNLSSDDEKVVSYFRKRDNFDKLNNYLSSLIKLKPESPVTEAKKKKPQTTNPVYILDNKNKFIAVNDFIRSINNLKGNPATIDSEMAKDLNLTTQAIAASIDKLFKIFLTNLSYSKIQTKIQEFQTKKLSGDALIKEFYKYIKLDGFYGNFIFKIALSSDEKDKTKKLQDLGLSDEAVKKLYDIMKGGNVKDEAIKEKLIVVATQDQIKNIIDPTEKDKVALTSLRNLKGEMAKKSDEELRNNILYKQMMGIK
jgi:hypothetical protein